MDATKEGPFCILYDVYLKTIRGTEDCLKLNVYTHAAAVCIQYTVRQYFFFMPDEYIKILSGLLYQINNSSSSEKLLRPVMVYIHGGSWSENSGNGETGMFRPDYFLDRDVVLVTINYRLEALGTIYNFTNLSSR